MEKTCLSCNLSKDLSEFHTDRSRKDLLNVYCKPCMRAKTKEYRVRPLRHKSPEGMRRCEVCHETKAATEFYAAKTNAEGLSKRCKTCAKSMVQAWRAKNPERHRAGSKKWADNNREQIKDATLRAKYGISLETYNAMLAAQGGHCAICGAEASNKLAHRLHVDHSHDDGRVRGLLCSNCNTGIGQFRHRETLLQAAIKYLQVLPEGGVES